MLLLPKALTVVDSSTETRLFKLSLTLTLTTISYVRLLSISKFSVTLSPIGTCLSIFNILNCSPEDLTIEVDEPPPPPPPRLTTVSPLPELQSTEHVEVVSP